MSYRQRSRSPLPLGYREKERVRDRGFSPSRPRSPPSPSDLRDRRFAEQQDPRIPPPRRYDDQRESDRDYRDYDRGYDRDHERGYDRDYGGRGRGYDRDNERRDRDYDRDRPPSARREYYDRDREPQRDKRDDGYYENRRANSPDKWERGRDLDDSYSDRGRRVPSEPSRQVIFLGIDPELTEQEVEHRMSVEATKIMRDKVSGKSKNFAFAHFSTLSDAKAFIDKNFPSVFMPALHSHSVSKRVKIDFAGPSPGQSVPNIPHDGTSDIGSPSAGKRVLLLRGLHGETSPKEIIRRVHQEISRMIGKSGVGGISRVVRIVDRVDLYGWGFAFVELATPELAAALLPFLLSPQSQPQGFVIDELPVAASFANPAAFVPAAAGLLGGQFLIKASKDGGIGSDTIGSSDGEWCSYWHGQGGAQETVVASEMTPELRQYLGHLAGSSAQSIKVEEQPQTNNQPPPPLTPMQPIKIGFTKVKKKEEDAIIPISVKNALKTEDDEDLIGKDTVLLSRTKGAHMIPPTSTSRKIAKNISKWNTKQTELAAPVPPKDPSAPPRGISSANAVVEKRPMPSPVSSSVTEDDFDFSDLSTLATTGKVACLLCQRQFKSEDILRKHMAQSDLHKTNMLDEKIRQAGMRRKQAFTTQTSSEADGPKYRDRAAERREVFNQPEKPNRDQAESSKRRFAEGPKPLPPPPPPPSTLQPGQDESNVGNQLLAKMGWTTGSGLGKEGEGRVDPINVQQFENRAGLGAAKGYDPSKFSGPGGWQARGQEVTRTRYDSAGSNGS